MEISILVLAIASLCMVITIASMSCSMDILNKKINRCEKNNRKLAELVEEKQFKTRLKKECNSGNCYTNRLK